MARMRSLKPEFWLDRKLARSLTRDQRMLYLGLWNQADEWGRAQADSRLIQGQVFPYEDDLSPDDIAVMLKALEVAGVVQLYDVAGDPYLFLPNLAKHQRLEAAKVPSRHPAPPEQVADQQVHAAPESHADESARGTDEPAAPRTQVVAKHVAGSREHVAGQRGADTSAQTPTPKPKAPDRGTRLPDDFVITDDMRRWATAQGWSDHWVDSVTERFRDYWRGQPGQRGVKTDWVATWRNWLRKDAENGRPLAAVAGAAAGRQNPPWEL